MIDYKFKEDDWFSTENLTEEQYKIIEQEIYAQGILNCADYKDWSEHDWNERDWGVFSDKDDVLLFGSFGFGDVDNKLDTDMILKQIEESKMTDEDKQVEIKVGQTYRLTEEGKQKNYWEYSKDGVTLVTITEVDNYGEGLSGIPEDDERYIVQESAINDGLIELVVDTENTPVTPEPEFSLDKQAETIRKLNEKLLQQQKEVEQTQLELKQAKELFDDLAKKARGCEIEVEVSDEEPVVNDFENWKVGDTVKCLSTGEWRFTVGDTYIIDKFDLSDTHMPVRINNEYWIAPYNGDTFIKVS